MLKSLNDTRSGLQPFIRHNPTTPDVAVILVGTNDLGHKRSPGDIIKDVVSLHRKCFEEGVRRTVAVGIPPSAWQVSNKAAASAAKEVNDGLKEFCGKTKDMGGFVNGTSEIKGLAKFVEFPFTYAKDDQRWSDDGLHLKPLGYSEFGKALAFPVEEILAELRQNKTEKQQMQKKSWWRKKQKPN